MKTQTQPARQRTMTLEAIRNFGQLERQAKRSDPSRASLVRSVLERFTAPKLLPTDQKGEEITPFSKARRWG